MYHREGGAGVRLLGNRGDNGTTPVWPSVSSDGKYLYYQVSTSVSDHQPLSGAYQIRRFAFQSGEILDMTEGEGEDSASGGAVAPEISPRLRSSRVSGRTTIGARPRTLSTTRPARCPA